MLHIVNKSHLERSALDACLRIATGGTLLLIEDGVYAALAGTPGEAKLRDAMARFKVCALAPDLEARGVADRVMEGVALVDYGGFVDLVASHPTCQSWL